LFFQCLNIVDLAFYNYINPAPSLRIKLIDIVLKQKRLYLKLIPGKPFKNVAHV